MGTCNKHDGYIATQGFEDRECIHCNKRFWAHNGAINVCYECVKEYDICEVCGEPIEKTK